MIARVAGERLAKVCLELGGKNPLVVCDDADLEGAATAAALSAFSNAGQRCAAGSRLIVFDAVYDRFRELLLERPNAQKVGPGDEHDFGPVINERQLESMLAAVERAREAGATVLTGGERLTAARLLRRADDRRGRRARLGDLLHRALRPDHDAAPRVRLRGGDRDGQREPVRPDRGDLDRQRAPRQEFVRRVAAGGVPGQRPDVRLRATRALRRAEAIPALAGASPGRKRSTSTPTGRRCT